ncbi:MAG: uroporphyrinogen-III C-methyltransferase [Caldimonas sp.]
MAIGFVLLAILSILALALAWRADQRVHGSERELVRRQQEMADRVAESNLLARQSQDGMRDAVAKVALLEAHLNEVTVQRSQLEELIQSVARSRDENLVAEIEAALRAAVQQAALTGSAEPIVATLKQADDRLAHASQPRLDPVRRAIARDIDRVKAASVTDVASLSIKLDEAVRIVDELPLLSAAEPRRDLARTRAAAAIASAPVAEPAVSAPTAADEGLGAWIAREFGAAGRFVADRVWGEVRSLVRITRIDQPEAMLVAPDQAFFLRENLKLRLLNARLALMARQYDAAQADVRWAQGAIARYFDRSSRRTQAVSELLRQVSQQSRYVGIPRPDETLAALAAASGPR